MKRMLLTSFISLLSIAAHAMNINTGTTNQQIIKPSMPVFHDLLIECKTNAEWRTPQMTFPTPPSQIAPSKYLLSPKNRNKIMYETNGSIRILPLNQNHIVQKKQ